MDEDYGSWSVARYLAVGMGFVVLCVIALGLFVMSSFKLVKKQDPIKWINKPFTQETNEKGEAIGNVMIGFDEKGYVRWGSAPLQQTPQVATQSAPTPVPATPSREDQMLKAAKARGK